MPDRNTIDRMRRDGDFIKAEKLLASGELKAAESLMRLAARKGNTFARIELSRMYLRKSERWDGKSENLSVLTDFFSGRTGAWAAAMAAICRNVSDAEVNHGLLELKRLSLSGDPGGVYYHELCRKKPWAAILRAGAEK